MSYITDLIATVKKICDSLQFMCKFFQVCIPLVTRNTTGLSCKALLEKICTYFTRNKYIFQYKSFYRFPVILVHESDLHISKKKLTKHHKIYRLSPL